MKFEHKSQASTTMLMFLPDCGADSFLYDEKIYTVITDHENLIEFDGDREFACINLSNQSVEFFSRETHVTPVELSATYTSISPQDQL